MSNIDQRRINNQRSGFIDARQAARLLDVKLPTLYAYVSRGLVRSVAAETGRARLYSRADVERLRARRDARRGHGAVAAGALRWGEPVLDSRITQITPEGPMYRGEVAVELARHGHEFEAVAELLWTGQLGESPTWPAPLRLAKLGTLVGSDATPCDVLAVAVAVAAARDADRHVFDVDAARRLLGLLASTLSGTGAGIAHAVDVGLGGRATRRHVAAVNKALIVIADHELNVSTFACRVAASAGADLYASVAAGLAALSGPRHGGMCDRVEALLAECGDGQRAPQVIRERRRRGDPIPGFAHPLYPDGDPRAQLLLAEARALAPKNKTVATALAVERAMKRSKLYANVDLALVALAGALRLRRGAAAAMFAIGRSAGWIAHAMEQREAGFMLRPRARYVSS